MNQYSASGPSRRTVRYEALGNFEADTLFNVIEWHSEEPKREGSQTPSKECLEASAHLRRQKALAGDYRVDKEWVTWLLVPSSLENSLMRSCESGRHMF